MRTMKRAAAVALSVVMLMTSGVTAKAAVTDAQPAKSSSEAVEKWAKQIGATYNTMTDLKIVGDYIYLAENANKRVVKLDKETGDIVAQHKFSGDGVQDYYADIAYGDGKVYVEYTNHKIEAYDAETLTPVWISEAADDSVASKLTYKDKKLYFGTGAFGNSGSFYVLDTTDEDPSSENEEKSIQKITTSTTGTFYWKKGIDIGNYIIVSDTKGNVTSIDTDTQKVVATFSVNDRCGGGIAYDKTTGTIYFVAGTNNLYGVKVNEDGTFGQSEHVQVYATGYVSMTPEVYNGKVYLSGSAGSNGWVDPGYVAVVDVTKSPYTVKWTYNKLAKYAQCEFLISKAGNSPQVYFTINDQDNGGIYSIKESADGENYTVENIYEPQDDEDNEIFRKQSCMRDVCVDEDGNMYYSNDAGYVFAVGKKSSSDPVKPTQPTTTETKPTTTTQTKPTTSVKPITKTQTSTRSVKLTWKKNKSAKGYVIYAKAGKGKYKKLTTVGKTTKKTVTVKSGTFYKFKVKPYKYTKKKGKKVKKYYKAYAAKAKYGSKTVKVTYKNVKGYTSYRIDMKVGNGSYKKVLTSKKTGTLTLTYTQKKAKVGKSYKFRLVGIKTVNGKSVEKTIK